VDALLARAGNHPGAGHLSRALDIYRDDPAFTRSKLERRFRELVRRSGLPMPTSNLWVGDYELDAYDREREEELLLRGIETIRVTGPRLRREPRKVLRRVEAHLQRRRRQIAAGVAWLRPQFREAGGGEVAVEGQRVPNALGAHVGEAGRVDEGVLALVVGAEPVEGLVFDLRRDGGDLHIAIRRPDAIQEVNRLSMPQLAPEGGPGLASDVS